MIIPVFSLALMFAGLFLLVAQSLRVAWNMADHALDSWPTKKVSSLMDGAASIVLFAVFVYGASMCLRLIWALLTGGSFAG